MTPEQLMRDHTLAFVTHLMDNWGHQGYWTQRLKDGPIEWKDMDKWKNKRDYSIVSTTDRIYDSWIQQQATNAAWDRTASLNTANLKRP